MGLVFPFQGLQPPAQGPANHISSPALTLQELVELLNVLVPALSVTDIDDDIQVLSLGANHQAYSQTRAGVRAVYKMWGHTQRAEDGYREQQGEGWDEDLRSSSWEEAIPRSQSSQPWDVGKESGLQELPSTWWLDHQNHTSENSAFFSALEFLWEA